MQKFMWMNLFFQPNDYKSAVSGKVALVGISMKFNF